MALKHQYIATLVSGPYRESVVVYQVDHTRRLAVAAFMISMVDIQSAGTSSGKLPGPRIMSVLLSPLTSAASMEAQTEKKSPENDCGSNLKSPLFPDRQSSRVQARSTGEHRDCRDIHVAVIIEIVHDRAGCAVYWIVILLGKIEIAIVLEYRTECCGRVPVRYYPHGFPPRCRRSAPPGHLAVTIEIRRANTVATEGGALFVYHVASKGLIAIVNENHQLLGTLRYQGSDIGFAIVVEIAN